MVRHREAPGGPQRVSFTIRGCTELTQNTYRAFNGARGTHRISNHGSLAFPRLSRDPRPVGSQPPYGAGQSSNSYPVDYRPTFAYSDLPYPLILRRILAGHFPPSLWERLGLPCCTRVPFLKDVGTALPPAVHHLRGGKGRPPDLTAHLLVHAYKPLWHVAITTAQQRFTCIGHILQR